MSDQEEYHLVHMDNNMIEVLYQLKDAGFESYIKYQAGKISQKNQVLHTKTWRRRLHLHNISSRDLLNIYIYSERRRYRGCSKYSRLTKAMFAFNRAIFSESDKSKYDDMHVSILAILDECRIIAPIRPLP